MSVPRSRDEQQAIADSVRATDLRIEADTRELHKLRSLKSGLMTDLLTGRVRVPELLEDVDGLVGTMAKRGE